METVSPAVGLLVAVLLGVAVWVHVKFRSTQPRVRAQQPTGFRQTTNPARPPFRWRVFAIMGRGLIAVFGKIGDSLTRISLRHAAAGTIETRAGTPPGIPLGDAFDDDTTERGSSGVRLRPGFGTATYPGRPVANFMTRI